MHRFILCQSYMMSRWFCNPPPLIWGCVLLYLRLPRGGCCSISDDLSCSFKHSKGCLDLSNSRYKFHICASPSVHSLPRYTVVSTSPIWWWSTVRVMEVGLIFKSSVFLVFTLIRRCYGLSYAWLQLFERSARSSARYNVYILTEQRNCEFLKLLQIYKNDQKSKFMLTFM